MGQQGDDGLEAAERAIALDPNLAEAHAAKGVVLTFQTKHDEALVEIQKALTLDPESYEVNKAAARLYYTMRNHDSGDPSISKRLRPAWRPIIGPVAC